LQPIEQAEEQHDFDVRKGLITAPSIFTAGMLANHALSLMSCPAGLLKLYCPGNKGLKVKTASFQLITLLDAPVKVSVKCNTGTMYDQAVTLGETQKSQVCASLMETMKIKQMAG